MCPAISAAESVSAFSFIFLMRSSVWDCFLRSFLKWAESCSRDKAHARQHQLCTAAHWVCNGKLDLQMQITLLIS